MWRFIFAQLDEQVATVEPASSLTLVAERHHSHQGAQSGRQLLDTRRPRIPNHLLMPEVVGDFDSSITSNPDTVLLSMALEIDCIQKSGGPRWQKHPLLAAAADGALKHCVQ